MIDSRAIEFENIKVGDCKKSSCCKLSDVAIVDTDDERHFVRESYKSLCEKEGYDLENLPKGERISIVKKLTEIRQKRLLDWQEKQLDKIGKCPHHN